MATANTTNLTKVEIRYVPDEKLGAVYFKAQMGEREGFLSPADMRLTDVPGLDHTKRAVNHPKNLETIFKHYQDIDGTPDERCAQLKVRSMTVGDCIVDLTDNTAYYVTSKDVAESGFVVIKDDKIVPVPVQA